MASRKPGPGARRAKSRQPARVRETWNAATAPSAGVCYVESSALAAGLLDGEHAAWKAVRQAGRCVTSALTIAETARAIVRARVTGRIDRDQEVEASRSLHTFEASAIVAPVTGDILARVGRPFPVEPVRTLDAIHLATLELLGEPPHAITVLTRDARVRENALAMGYRVA